MGTNLTLPGTGWPTTALPALVITAAADRPVPFAVPSLPASRYWTAILSGWVVGAAGTPLACSTINLPHQPHALCCIPVLASSVPGLVSVTRRKTLHGRFGLLRAIRMAQQAAGPQGLATLVINSYICFPSVLQICKVRSCLIQTTGTRRTQESTAMGQQWEVGKAVIVNKRELFVTGTLPPARKGEAGRYLLETLDRSKAYEWTPFRGLKLVRGELVRPDRARKRKAQRRAEKRAKAGASTRVRAVTNRGLFARLSALFRRRVKRRRKVTITRPPGAAIGTPPGQP